MSVPLLATLLGCANRGNPRPPSLHLPGVVTDLKAQRVAERVVLVWTTSDKTSDGLLLHSPITAILCRDDVRQSLRQPAPCTAISRFSVSPGASRAEDLLPPALQTDPPGLLAYRVELLNPRNRSAGVSLPVFAPFGAAPPNPGAIHVTATRHGAVIKWTPASSGATMELTRSLVESSRATAQVVSAERGPGSAGPLITKPKEKGLVILRATSEETSDSGGLLDPGVVPQATYTYTAQRVRTVQLEGRSYRLQSAVSPVANFSYRDIFPPPPPTGLESMAAAPVSGAESIDLSWDASAESDVLGYNVYRADAAGVSFTRLNPALVPSPSYRDMTAQPGKVYRYRVTAVDRSGNEGAPCTDIRDSLPSRP